MFILNNNHRINVNNIISYYPIEKNSFSDKIYYGIQINYSNSVNLGGELMFTSEEERNTYLEKLDNALEILKL